MSLGDGPQGQILREGLWGKALRGRSEGNTLKGRSLGEGLQGTVFRRPSDQGPRGQAFGGRPSGTDL